MQSWTWESNVRGIPRGLRQRRPWWLEGSRRPDASAVSGWDSWLPRWAKRKLRLWQALKDKSRSFIDTQSRDSPRATSLAADELGHHHSTERLMCSTIYLGLSLGREKLYLLWELNNSHRTDSLPLRFILESASWEISNREHSLKRKTCQKWTGTPWGYIPRPASTWPLNIKSHWRWTHDTKL